MEQIIIFILQIIALFFVSRMVINTLFAFFSHFIHHRHTVYAIISIIFLPGTILHELAHFFAATVLFLTVYDVKIFPEFKGANIKLGSVIYQKADVVRGLLVGIAPIFVGLLFFFFISVFNLFPSDKIFLNIGLAYLLFVVSSTMFSSKQDLVDLVFILPVAIFVGGAIYILNLDISLLFSNNQIIKNMVQFLKDINLYLFLSLILNGLIFIILKSFLSFLK